MTALRGDPLLCRPLPVLVRSGPDQPVTVGQDVHLEVDPTGWRLFDTDGEALLHGPQAPARQEPQPQLPRLG